MHLSNASFSSFVSPAGNLEWLRLQRESHSRPNSGGARRCADAPDAVEKAMVVPVFGPIPTPSPTKKPAVSKPARTAVEQEYV